MYRLMLSLATVLCLWPLQLPAQCGGVERWAVKMAADPDAVQIDDQNPVVTSLHDLVRLVRPALPSDDETRVTQERRVRIVDARLVRFKQETGKDGDSDFHLVISDETLLYTAGGAASPVSPHSFIAEIPHPDCVAGRHGAVTSPSRFGAQMTTVRDRFLQRYPNIQSGWNEAGGVRVRLTGVVFFDRPHGQVGRALNGLELHPLLDLVFDPPPLQPLLQPPVQPPAITIVTVENGDFESGATGWTATDGVITTNANQPAHGGTGKAWLGGYGSTHTDRLWQQVVLPSGVPAISLTFFLHINTEETGAQAFDRLRVRVRSTSGQILQTLATYSNQDAAPGYTLRSLNLTPFRGRTVRIELEAREDASSTTSFVVDDVAIRVGGP